MESGCSSELIELIELKNQLNTLLNKLKQCSKHKMNKRLVDSLTCSLDDLKLAVRIFEKE